MNQETKQYEPWLVETVERAKKQGHTPPFPERFLLTSWARHNGWREGVWFTLDEWFSLGSRHEAFKEFREKHPELFEKPKESREPNPIVPVLPIIMEFVYKHGLRRSSLTLDEFIFHYDLWPTIREKIVMTEGYDAKEFCEWDLRMAYVYKDFKRGRG